MSDFYNTEYKAVGILINNYLSTNNLAQRPVITCMSVTAYLWLIYHVLKPIDVNRATRAAPVLRSVEIKPGGRRLN